MSLEDKRKELRYFILSHEGKLGFQPTYDGRGLTEIRLVSHSKCELQVTLDDLFQMAVEPRQPEDTELRQLQNEFFEQFKELCNDQKHRRRDENNIWIIWFDVGSPLHNLGEEIVRATSKPKSIEERALDLLEKIVKEEPYPVGTITEILKEAGREP